MIAARCGAADVVARPFMAAELVFRIGRAVAAGERAEKRRSTKRDLLIGTGIGELSLQGKRQQQSANPDLRLGLGCSSARVHTKPPISRYEE